MLTGHSGLAEERLRIEKICVDRQAGTHSPLQTGSGDSGLQLEEKYLALRRLSSVRFLFVSTSATDVTYDARDKKRDTTVDYTTVQEHIIVLIATPFLYKKYVTIKASVQIPMTSLYVSIRANLVISVLPDKVFRDLPVLYMLNLSKNHISVLPDQVFRELPVLRIVYLSNNQISITSLPTLSASVESLDISYNDFSHLTFSTFTNYSNLSFLDITGNKLKVKQHMFEGLDNLIVLLTDTPFMCCVKPKSVAEDRCLNRQYNIFRCMFEPDTCKSEEDMISSCDNLIGSDLLRVFLWIIGVCALIGNFAVMFYRLLIDRDNIRTSYSIFVLNLSVSDFLMGIYLMMIGTFDVNYRDMYAWNDQDWRKSIICTIAGIVSNVSSEMSTFLILMVTIDRAIVIVSPMSRLSRRNISWKQACLISFFLWLVAITIAIIPAVSLQFYFKNEYYSQSGVCLALPLTGDEQPGSEYSFAVFVCLNSFVFVIIAIGQLCMFKSLMTSGGSRVASSLTRQRDMIVARTLFLVVATDFFCWFPIGVMGLMSKSGYKISNDAYAWVMVFVLPVNAAINPFLYTVSAIWRKRQRAR
ncbi:G-protein coupled receptor GRL101-like [Ylistrum balloti]|uniref:G-protein coupled receptor GRL101-like n=1 Tax=Ylistrum balloti TaxID=509963 RepID=UPI00290592D1|nr:G-protein coupled receptor GRL101-like [Ylistrum balloti]